MVPIQPTNLSTYISKQHMHIPPNLNRYFYVSWEDALWDILKYKNIPPNSMALVPYFFCTDVVDNMKTHGITSTWYPCDEHFQTDPYIFKEWLQRYQPHIVIIFHAVGITNRLFETRDIWLPYLKKDAILIEDSVHRIVDPAHIQLITTNHIVIDSLRKVSPIPGSNMYCSVDFEFNKKIHQTSHRYRFNVLYWWIVFQLCLYLVTIFPFRKWKTYWNSLAEKSMLIGYDVIGDNYTAGKGWRLAEHISSYLHFEQIEATKKDQVNMYVHGLKELSDNPALFQITYSEQDTKLLRGFPLGLRLPQALTILEELRKCGLTTRFELNDSPWSRTQKVIYLPLGSHLKTQDITWVIHCVKKVVSHIQSSPAQY